MIPDLASYDLVEVSSSAGKDSQAMTFYVAGLLREAGLLDRGVVVHADLGRVEWPGTPELAEEHARRAGMRFVKVKRRQGDLLAHVEKLGKWPMPTQRFCTADHKRQQIHRALTALAAEVRARRPRAERREPVRILNCVGLRAEESPGRAKRAELTRDRRPSGRRKIVDVWLPIQGWTEAEVWAAVRASGAPVHPAYAAGLPRASCIFCLAGETEVVTRSGIQPIRDLAGGIHPLLIPKFTGPPNRRPGLHGHGTFKDVEVRALGVQLLLRMSLRRAKQTKVVYATAEHRWLVLERALRSPKRGDEHNGYELITREQTTATLRRGDVLRSLKAQPLDSAMAPIQVPFAIAQGFVFGDGSLGDDQRPATLPIYNLAKDSALLPFFAAHEIKTIDRGVRINGLPRHWKRPPPLDESRSYLLSWLAGYFAADGCVSKNGQATRARRR